MYRCIPAADHTDPAPRVCCHSGGHGCGQGRGLARGMCMYNI